MTFRFPEWSRNYSESKSSRIPWLDALSAQGKEELVEIVERDKADRRYLDDLFGA